MFYKNLKKKRKTCETTQGLKEGKWQYEAHDDNARKYCNTFSKG